MTVCGVQLPLPTLIGRSSANFLLRDPVSPLFHFFTAWNGRIPDNRQRHATWESCLPFFCKIKIASSGRPEADDFAHYGQSRPDNRH